MGANTKVGHRPTILHILPGLRAGGAEQVLRMIVTNPDTGFNHHVVSLSDYGDLGSTIERAGVPVACLGARGIFDGPATLLRLRKVYRTIRHDVVHAWLYHGVAAATALRLTSAPIIGALHATGLELPRRAIGTRAAFILAKRGLGACHEVVFCSQTALDYHVRSGFPIDRYIVIDNGVDATVFDNKTMSKEEARSHFRIPPEQALIGMAARFDPQKDHRTLLAALRLVRLAGIPARLFLVGHKMDASNASLRSMIEEYVEATNVILGGYISEMPHFFSALDVAVLSSSYGEAWPLSVGEAMAMRCPIVVTDVGDSARMLGEFGFVVPPRKPEMLAKTIIEALGMSPDQRTLYLDAARERIVKLYSSQAMLAKYESMYERALAQAAASPALRQSVGPYEPGAMGQKSDRQLPF